MTGVQENIELLMDHFNITENIIDKGTKYAAVVPNLLYYTVTLGCLWKD